MILGNSEIHERINNGGLDVSPYEKDNIQPASIDLRLGSEFARIEPAKNHLTIDTRNESSIMKESIQAERLVLQPGEVLLGTTIERVDLSKSLAGIVVGRSSLGRLNIVVHKTAGFIDPGFTGQITLELENEGEYPVVLYAGSRVCQIWFAEVTNCDTGYDTKDTAKYNNQSGVTVTEAPFFSENQNL